jgi:C-terminal processing protease CtpA/Prc
MENYVFPDVAERMTQHLKNQWNQGAYAVPGSPAELAIQLTKDLQYVSHDKHLRVIYSPQVIAAERKAAKSNDRTLLDEEQLREMRRENFGFQELNILDGNIGYLDLRGFMDPQYARETAVSAMHYFRDADALIIDLRKNGGGSPEMIRLISSYFFSSKPVHLNSFYDRVTNQTTESWTLADIPGVRRPDLDLYILTSRQTFSAAEEFTYNLKNLKRATVIGERTAGGAHPTGSVIATDKFFVRVPKARAINPITQTNWEGTGVIPDIEVTADAALKTAYAKALEKQGK